MTQDASSLQSICKESVDLLLGAGYVKSPSTITMSDRSTIVKTLSMHFVLLKSKAEMDQFKLGLTRYGILEPIQQHRTLFSKVFTSCGDDRLTAGMLRHCKCRCD